VRNLVYIFFSLELLFILTQGFFDLNEFMVDFIVKSKQIAFLFSEANFKFDLAQLITRVDNIRSLGYIFYTEYKVTVVLASILLFVSIIGALALTLYFPASKFSVEYINIVKTQNIGSNLFREIK